MRCNHTQNAVVQCLCYKSLHCTRLVLLATTWTSAIADLIKALSNPLLFCLFFHAQPVLSMRNSTTEIWRGISRNQNTPKTSSEYIAPKCIRCNAMNSSGPFCSHFCYYLDYNQFTKVYLAWLCCYCFTLSFPKEASQGNFWELCHNCDILCMSLPLLLLLQRKRSWAKSEVVQ